MGLTLMEAFERAIRRSKVGCSVLVCLHALQPDSYFVTAHSTGHGGGKVAEFINGLYAEEDW